MDQFLALQHWPLLLAGHTSSLGAFLVPGAMGHICVGSPGLSSMSQCRGVGTGVWPFVPGWLAIKISPLHICPSSLNTTQPALTQILGKPTAFQGHLVNITDFVVKFTSEEYVS